MKTVIAKLIKLADALDSLGLKKHADALGYVIVKTAAGEDFGDYLNMFDSPIELEDQDEELPGARKVVMDEPEIHTPLDEEEAPLSKEKTRPSRLDDLKRRYELLKLKKMLPELARIERAEEAEEELEQHEEPEAEDKELRPKLVLPEETPEDTFEDEDDENDVDDEEGFMSKLKDILKGSPALAKKIVKLVNDNPELLELAL